MASKKNGNAKNKNGNNNKNAGMRIYKLSLWMLAFFYGWSSCCTDLQFKYDIVNEDMLSNAIKIENIELSNMFSRGCQQEVEKNKFLKKKLQKRI